MRTLLILLIHTTALAFVVWTIVQTGQRAQPLLYGFILDYLLRLLTIAGMIRLLERGRSEFTRRAVTGMTRPPAPGQPSYPLKYGKTYDTGRPSGFGAYLAVLALLTYFGVILVNVDARQEISTTAGTFASDFGWGTLIGLVYWTESLASRTIVVNPTASLSENLGYNTREVTVLALAVLTGGMVVAARQSMGLDASGWVVLGPLLGFKALYDVSTTLQLAKTA